jgi:acetyltransferase
MATITIRELLPSDHRALVFTFRHLSEQSRYQRYFTVKPELPSRDLARLVDVDHWHHEALIAFSPAPRAPIGIARYVRLEEFDVAEVAIEVVDGWQRHGVGSALMAALTQRAVRAGIRRFHLSILRDNAGARALARKLAPQTPAPPATVLAAAGNVVELTYSLSGASSGPAGSSGAGSPPPSPPSAPTPTGVG